LLSLGTGVVIAIVGCRAALPSLGVVEGGGGWHCVGEVIIVSIVALWWSELVVVTVVSWCGLGIGHISHEWPAWVAGLYGVCVVGVHPIVGW